MNILVVLSLITVASAAPYYQPSPLLYNAHDAPITSGASPSITSYSGALAINPYAATHRLTYAATNGWSYPTSHGFNYPATHGFNYAVSPVRYGSPLAYSAPLIRSANVLQPGYFAQNPGATHIAPLPEGLGYASYHINNNPAPQ